MKEFNASERRTTRRLPLVAYAAAVVAGLVLSLSAPARAVHVTVPPLPASLEVLPPNRPFLLGKATGTQNYVCLPSGIDAAGNQTFAWKLYTPQATLFSAATGEARQVATHFFSPNPDEVNSDPLVDFHPVRAAWQSSKDTSTVWAKTMVASDAVVVTPGTLPWLKLTVVGSQNGRGGDLLTVTTFIQRVNTSGGLAPPADTCDSQQEVGRQAFREYTADYIFYTDQ